MFTIVLRDPFVSIEKLVVCRAWFKKHQRRLPSLSQRGDRDAPVANRWKVCEAAIDTPIEW